MLATLAMAMCAVAAFAFRARRGRVRLQPDRQNTARDLRAFLCAMPVAIALGLVHSPPLRYAGAAVLVAAYATFTWRTITRSRPEADADEPPSLYFDTTKGDPPSTFQVLVQSLVGVGMLVGAAELFVTSIEHLAHGLGIDELVLTLVIAPLATELPETINSLTWIRQGKDTLALGNITGAMVFQSMLPVAFGLVFTDWNLTAPALLAMLAAVAGAGLSLLVLLHPMRSRVPVIGCWTGLYLAGVTSIIAIA